MQFKQPGHNIPTAAVQEGRDSGKFVGKCLVELLWG